MDKCVAYPGSRSTTGHTQVCIWGGRHYGHRVSYCAFNKVSLESIAGKVVRHSCDNPGCVNPRHLLLGTDADNTEDKVSRGRQFMKVPREELGTIRSRYAAGGISQRSMAVEYGVTQSAISDIITQRFRKEALNCANQ